MHVCVLSLHADPTNTDVKDKLAWAKAQRADGNYTIPSTIGVRAPPHPFQCSVGQSPGRCKTTQGAQAHNRAFILSTHGVCLSGVKACQGRNHLSAARSGRASHQPLPALRGGRRAQLCWAGGGGAGGCQGSGNPAHAQGPLGSQRGCHQRRAVGAQLGAATGAFAGGEPLRPFARAWRLEAPKTKRVRRHAHKGGANVLRPLPAALVAPLDESCSPLALPCGSL